LESNHHHNYIRTSLRFLIVCNRKITGVKLPVNSDFDGWLMNLGRKKLRMLQLRMLGTKVDAGKTPGMLEVNRHRTGDPLLGVISQRSKFNWVATRTSWMLHSRKLVTGLVTTRFMITFTTRSRNWHSNWNLLGKRMGKLPHSADAPPLPRNLPGIW
jgi:hypothetical protein